MSSTLLSSQLEALELLTEEERALGDKEYETSEQSLPELVSSIIQQLATQYETLQPLLSLLSNNILLKSFIIE